MVCRSTYKDVPAEWLGGQFVNDAEHLKEVNPDAYENEYMGHANGNGGNVFEFVEVRAIADEEISHMDRLYCGVDFGWVPGFVLLSADVLHDAIGKQSTFWTNSV
ncbi:MAG: hypothetical protein ACLR8P_13835 [Clostridium fessum]